MVRVVTIIHLLEAPNPMVGPGEVVVIIVGWWEIKSLFCAYFMLGLFGYVPSILVVGNFPELSCG